MSTNINVPSSWSELDKIINIEPYKPTFVMNCYEVTQKKVRNSLEKINYIHNIVFSTVVLSSHKSKIV